jgi:hypothetical protein
MPEIEVKNVIALAFFTAIVGVGLWCIFAPQSAMDARHRRGYSRSNLLGAYYYRTTFATRVTGTMFLGIGLFGVVRYVRELLT